MPAAISSGFHNRPASASRRHKSAISAFLFLAGQLIHQVQQAAACAPPVSPLILEAETGSGKTEAALWRFKALFEAGEVDSLCFLRPSRVAATGIYERILNCTRAASTSMRMARSTSRARCNARGQRLASCGAKS